MTTRPPVKRYRMNPVEVAILSVMVLIVGHSVYNLVHDQAGFHPDALGPMAARDTFAAREPASVSPMTELSVSCDQAGEQAVHSARVRLSGALCEKSGKLISTRISNDANHFTATVFPDEANQKFSTDYIPLQNGENAVSIEFIYQGGKSYAHTFKIRKF